MSKKYVHSCKRCLLVWKGKKWIKFCPRCGKDFGRTGAHRLRNILYGEDRHPGA